MRAARKFVIAAVYVLATVSAVAQVAIDMPSFGSYAGGPDMINLGNLNVHWTFPIGTKAGRGLPFSYPISYDSSIWAPITSSGVTSWVPPASSSFGWPTLAANNAGLPGSISYAISLQTLYNIPCNPPGLTLYSNCDLVHQLDLHRWDWQFAYLSRADIFRVPTLPISQSGSINTFRSKQ